MAVQGKERLWVPCRGLSLLTRVPPLEEQGLLRSLPALALGSAVLAAALRKARVGGSGVQHWQLGFSHLFSASACNLPLSSIGGFLFLSGGNLL